MSKKEKKAESLYANIYKDVVSRIGDKTTFASQLDGIGHEMLKVKFKGVFASDNIPRLNDLKPYCILNLDKSGEPGSHWISLAKIPDGKNVNGVKSRSLIYDSFGRGHKSIICQVSYSGNGRIIDSDRDVEQGITETSCGARSMAWLILLDRHGWEIAREI